MSPVRAAESWTPVVPATLQAELRDYQVEGFAWMSRLAADYVVHLDPWWNSAVEDQVRSGHGA